MTDNAASLRAGVAQIDITPPVGIDLTGYVLREGPSMGVHDPLHARALALESNGQTALLIICDLLGLERSVISEVRAGISSGRGPDPANTLVACTHTHSGPASISLRECGDMDSAWMETLRARLVRVGRRALADLQPARLGTGTGAVVGVAANRRQHQGAADPELGLLRITDTQNRTLGVLLNFACHPTSLDHRNRLISADYPGYAAIAVARAVGSWAACATGAAADVGPADRDPAPVSPLDEVSAASVRPHSEEGDPFVRAERLGHALADEGLRCLGDTPAEHLGPVAVATEKLSLPLLQTPTRAQLIAEVTRHGEMLATATIAGRHGEARIHRAMRSWAEETLAALEGDVAPHAVAAEVQVIRAGPVVLVGVPGECFVELGIAVKEALAGHPVLILSCANGNVGYIPTRSAYAEGGYEIDEAFKYYGYPAALAPEAGELVVDSAIRLAGQLLAED